jgi:S-formylglutathione hydrolase FrmB
MRSEVVRSAAAMSAWKVPIESRSETLFPGPLRGRIERHRFPSRVLEGNPLSDPTERELPVYLPPSGETEGKPLLVLLTGYAAAGWALFQRARYLDDSVVGRLDRLIRTGAVSEAVLVAPDCLTTLGGSQYLNSSATGRYEDYVVREVVPWVRERYRTGPTAVLGKSSGGYGALSLAMRYPEIFSAAASTAGDAYFEYCYLPDFPTTFRELRKAGGPEPLLRRVLSAPVSGFGPSHPMIRAFSTLAYASCYSPIDAEPGRFDLPFDLETGALREDVWARWLALDPVRMIGRDPFRAAARRLRALYIEGGTRDEFFLDLGARILASRAREVGAPVEFEEFEGGHFDGGPRHEAMISRLLRTLGPGSGARPPAAL